MFPLILIEHFTILNTGKDMLKNTIRTNPTRRNILPFWRAHIGRWRWTCPGRHWWRWTNRQWGWSRGGYAALQRSRWRPARTAEPRHHGHMTWEWSHWLQQNKLLILSTPQRTPHDTLIIHQISNLHLDFQYSFVLLNMSADNPTWCFHSGWFQAFSQQCAGTLCRWLLQKPRD